MDQETVSDCVARWCSTSQASTAADEDEKALLLKQLKAHAKQSDSNVKQVFDAIWRELHAQSSAVRCPQVPVCKSSLVLRGLLFRRIQTSSSVKVRTPSHKAAPNLVARVASLLAQGLVRPLQPLVQEPRPPHTALRLHATHTLPPAGARQRAHAPRGLLRPLQALSQAPQRVPAHLPGTCHRAEAPRHTAPSARRRRCGAQAARRAVRGAVGGAARHPQPAARHRTPVCPLRQGRAGANVTPCVL